MSRKGPRSRVHVDDHVACARLSRAGVLGRHLSEATLRSHTGRVRPTTTSGPTAISSLRSRGPLAVTLGAVLSTCREQSHPRRDCVAIRLLTIVLCCSCTLAYFVAVTPMLPQFLTGALGSGVVVCLACMSALGSCAAKPATQSFSLDCIRACVCVCVFCL